MFSNFKENFLETLRENANWLTITVVGLILVVGLTIINEPSRWWVAVIAVLSLSAVIFIAMNGRVVIKSVLSIIVLFLAIAGANLLGSSVGDSAFFNLAWPLYTLAGYFVCLAVSYIIYSARGRWLYLSTAVILQFALTFLFLNLGTSSNLSAVISLILSSMVFTLMYVFNGRNRHLKFMPENGFSKELFESLSRGADDLDMKLRLINGSRNVGPHFLLYGERSYIIYPIILDQAFGVTGRLGRQLSYKSKPINAWLMRLSFMLSLGWKSKGANPPLALLDLTRRNGSEGRLIGVSIPDTKRKSIVGVTPAPPLKMERESYGPTAIADVIRLMRDYSSEINEKQKGMLDKIGYDQKDFTHNENEEDLND